MVTRVPRSVTTRKSLRYNDLAKRPAIWAVPRLEAEGGDHTVISEMI